MNALIRIVSYSFFVITILTGCEDMIELEQQSYVVAIGIDLTEEKGVFSFTFQIANPEVGSTVQGAGSDQEAAETITITGTDIVSATNSANSFVTKQIILDQTKVLIISQALAETDQLLRVVQSASRTTQLRRGVQIIISKEDAQIFLNNNDPILEQRPHKYFQYMLTRAKQTGIIPHADIHRFFQITEGDADLFLGVYATTIPSETETSGSEDKYIAGQIPKQGGNPTQFMGAAVFKEGIMIDILTGEETRIVNILDKTMDMEELLTTYPDPVNPDYRIAANYIQKKNPEIDVSYDKDANHANINVTIPFELEILAIPSLVNYSQNDQYEQQLRDSIELYNETKTNELIAKTQQFYRAEPFYWSIYIRRFFRDIPAYEEADWNKNIYPNATINVDYQLTRLNFGKVLDDTNLNEVRD